MRRREALAAAADGQLSIELDVENLLLALPRRQNLVLGNVRPCRLPMTDRREPGQLRGQNGAVVLIARCSRRKQTEQGNAGNKCGGNTPRMLRCRGGHGDTHSLLVSP